MNKDKLKNIISKKAKGNSNVSAQLYQMYFFIMGGGLLLFSIIGVDVRTTKDMDATLMSLPLEKDNVIEIITEILNIKVPMF